MLAIAEDIIFSLPAGNDFFCLCVVRYFVDAHSDVVSKYTFLKQRIKPTGLTVEERELEAALLGLLQAVGCTQPSILESDSADSSFYAVKAVRSCQEQVRQQLQVWLCFKNRWL
jgi:hypothetical protein